MTETNEIATVNRNLLNLFKYPANLTEVTFSFIYYLFKYPVLNNVSKLAENLFNLVFLLCPYFPKVKGAEPTDIGSLAKSQISNFLIFFAVGLVVSLGGVVSIAFLEGRLFATQGMVTAAGFNVYNFGDDWANQLLYAFVVPVYVGLGAIIISICWRFQNQTSKQAAASGENSSVLAGTRPAWSGRPWQIAVWVLAAMVFCYLLSDAYHNDVWRLLLVEYNDHFDGSTEALRALPLYEAIFGSMPHPTSGMTEGKILYWFLKESAETPEGADYNIGGYYYIALNAVLMFYTVITVLFFLSASFSMINLTKKSEYINI